MALKRLTTIEMIALSEPWTTPGGALHELLRRIPEVAAILPRLKEAHVGLSELHPDDGDEDLASISAEAARVDERHDALVRGIHAVLSGFASLTTGGRSHQLVTLRDRLLPDGLSSTQKSYRDEAGHALLMQSRLTAADRALLAELPIPGANLLAAVEQWVVTARCLDELEDERAVQLQAQLEELRARNRWIKSVNALESNLVLGGLEEDAAEKVLRPVHEAERAAELRGSG